jgi:WD40 repeat protein
VYSTDWSPDGRTILYSLFYSGNPATTLDSLGLFLLDVTAGSSSQLRWGPDPVFSRYPRWSPDGRLIAMDELGAPDEALSVMNRDGTGHRFLIPPRAVHLYSRIDWYGRPNTGGARILFSNDTPSPKVGPYLINPDGTALLPFWHEMEFERFLSPSGAEYVRGAPDPASGLFVLYVGLVDDVTGVALRQVTKYEPPTMSPRALQGGAIHATRHE